MPYLSRDPRRLVAVAALLLVLVPVLGVLQYRWIGEVSRAERERMRSGIAIAASRAAGDFDREVGRAMDWFQPMAGFPPDPASHLVQRYREWRQQAPHPELLAGVWLATRDPEAPPSLQRFVFATGTLEPAAWPPELESVRQRLGERGPFRPGLRPEPRAPGDLSAVIPAGASPEDPRQQRDRELMDRPPARPSPSFIIVRLDEEVLRNQVPADAIGRHFPRDGDLVAAVRDRRNPEKLVFSSDPSFSLAGARAELSIPVFARRASDGPGFPPPPPDGDVRPDGRPEEERFPVSEMAADRGRTVPERQWDLLVFHRGGSLDEAVGTVRRRNLAVAGGILLVLTGAIALLLVSTRRAHALGGQQMEFIAGFTHELHTPLAAIRSAGQNLTDGVVTDPEQLRRYGSMIEREGRRLSEMVDTILEFARMQAVRTARPTGPVAIADIVERALSATRTLIEERGIKVETRIPSDLPPVSGDASALTRAVQNLIENAAKYGGGAGWIGIRASRSGSEIVVTVEDRGPGIGREELARLFEPFYRGRRGITMGIPGSGLGLSIVDRIARSHGGTLSAANNAAGGAHFSLHLPLSAENTRA